VWNVLQYPAGHAYEGQNIDFSFVIVPEPATVLLLILGGLATVRRCMV